MSMNIQFKATKGKAISIFDCIQTPTKVSYNIAGSANQKEAYKSWVKSLKDENAHIERFDAWVESFESEGFLVKAVVV